MTDEEKRGRCELTDNRLLPCWALEERLESPYGRGTRSRGLILHHMVDMKTHNFSRHVVAVRSGDAGKKGMAANFCPFCGTKILADD